MQDPQLQKERAQNLWASFTRKHEAMDRATLLDPLPEIEIGSIGGLGAAKDEILTYACAATNPDVYDRWGTFPPTGLLLLGQRGSGKQLLARMLAAQTHTSFLVVNIPRLVLEVIHRGGKVGELLQGWSETLPEMPPLTVFFDELEFSQAEEIGARRPDLPVGPVMDFLLDLIDRTIAVGKDLVVGSTSHPDTLRHAFSQPGRFERIVEVVPEFPDDIVAALVIHSADAEKRAGHPLFETIDWKEVVNRYRGPTTGEWVHILHSVLRRKARCEAAGEEVGRASTEDFLKEVERYRQTARSLPPSQSGNYV